MNTCSVSITLFTNDDDDLHYHDDNHIHIDIAKNYYIEFDSASTCTFTLILSFCCVSCAI